MTRPLWENPLQLKGEEGIMERYSVLNEKTVLLLGKGFDPRMCAGMRLLEPVGSQIDVVLLSYDEQAEHLSTQFESEIEKNMNAFESMESSFGRFFQKHITRDALPSSIKKAFGSDFLSPYKRVIIDVSALTQPISFNLIQWLFNNYRDTHKIDVYVCENSAFDDSLQPVGLEEAANYLKGFNTVSSDNEGRDDPMQEPMTLWIPLIGKNRAEVFTRIYALVVPKEVCPVLPFPSENPRRVDEIYDEIGEILFRSKSGFQVERKNLIYVPEDNPFQIYQKLCRVVNYYEKALREVFGNDFRVVFSTASSKLMGIGALLAYMDLASAGVKTSFARVSYSSYLFDRSNYDQSRNKSHIMCLCENAYTW